MIHLVNHFNTQLAIKHIHSTLRRFEVYPYTCTHRVLRTYQNLFPMQCNITCKNCFINMEFQILIKQYTWRGTLLVEAGFILNGLVCALVLIEPRKRHIAEQCVDVELDDIGSSTTTDADVANRAAAANNVDDEAEQEQYKLIPTDSVEQKMGVHIVDDTDVYSSNTTGNAKKADIDGHLYNAIAKHEEKALGNPNDAFVEYEPKLMVGSKPKQTTRRWLSLKPLMNPGFLVFVLSNILIELALNTPFIYLPDMMVNMGYSTGQAAFVITIIGKVYYMNMYFSTHSTNL